MVLGLPTAFDNSRVRRGVEAMTTTDIACGEGNETWLPQRPSVRRTTTEFLNLRAAASCLVVCSSRYLTSLFVVQDLVIQSPREVGDTDPHPDPTHKDG
jgi:hypothetical protein